MISRAKITGPISVGIVSASATRCAGGMFPIMQAHARQLAAGGIKPTIICARDEMSPIDGPSWEPLELQSYPRQLRMFAFAPTMKAGLQCGGYDLLHQHGLWQYPSVAVSHWRRRTGLPTIVSTQGMLEPWALANSKWKKRVATTLFERSNLSSAACIHCSVAEVEGIRSFGLRNPVAVIGNGSDLPALGSQSIRPSWLPDRGKKTLLFLGRLHPKKGIRETLDAWALLKTEHPEITDSWQLVFAGWDDGGHSNVIVRHAHALDLVDVIFPGPLYGEDKNAAYAHADAFILASHSEGLPMAVLEAWSYELPVFMTRECNLVEGFHAGAAIELSTDPQQIANVLTQYLRLDLTPFGRRGRELVKGEFCWPAVGEKLCEVYRWLVDGGPIPQHVLQA